MGNGNRIDEVLHTGKRSLRTMPKSILLGSTGARLWADYLEPVPGFCGRIDFIHKLNIPELFSVKNNFFENFEPCKIDWYPSHLAISYASLNIKFNEKKFITWDDCAVSCQLWENCGSEDLALRLTFDDHIYNERSGFNYQGVIKAPDHGYSVATVLAFNHPGLPGGIRLKPGDKIEVIIAASCGIETMDSIKDLEERLERFMRPEASMDAVVRDQQSDYQQWFDHIPVFQSNELLLNKTWFYRWYILRHTLADPRYGNLLHPLFYEGRSHKMTKTPFKPSGWEFSKMIPLSTPLHLMDAKWHHHPSDCEGMLKNLVSGQDENGFFPCLYVDKKLHSYANFIGWAAYQFYLVHGNEDIVKEVLPALKKQICAWKEKMGNAGDALLTEYIHQHTGKEYQPSYWYFHGFPRDCFDKSQYTPLKRVDRAVYQYVNVLGTARLCEIVNDPEAEDYYKFSEELRNDILKKMWDPDTQFFYDLHYLRDEKARVKNIVGFYPFWAQITDSRHSEGWNHLLSDEFTTGCPFPSVSADCPVYQAEGGWQGVFIKGRNGCVWDGPSWPYTNSIILDALAQHSKEKGHLLDSRFGYYLREYSFMHYSNRDMDRPYLVEHYNSQTGEPLSDEADYNHSYFIDIIIRHVAGLTMEKNHLVLDPVDIGLDYFKLDRVKARGMRICVTYKKKGIQPTDVELEEGYRLYVNGNLIHAGDCLQKVCYPLEKLQDNC